MSLSILTSALGLNIGATIAVANSRAAVSMAEIGDTKVAFSNVAREWRCKYSPGESGGPGDSKSLAACQELLTEFLPRIKALPKASVTRQVCGGCLDFKVSIVQPLDEHGEWAGADYNPLEEEFLAKLKDIDGVSQVETQEITFEAL
mmetsp:Transcript_4086/g.11909  ORF Transcript_4086/g.11909 Transcript_4086/m.11909 type:complete len:147 (+) Transcript_4086:1-441(+)